MFVSFLLASVCRAFENAPEARSKTASIVLLVIIYVPDCTIGGNNYAALKLLWDEMQGNVQMWLSTSSANDPYSGALGSPQFGSGLDFSSFGSPSLPLPNTPLSPGSYPPGLPTAVMVSDLSIRTVLVF